MIAYSIYEGETQLEEIITLVEKDLSEPYSIFVYQFFLVPHPGLCFLVLVYLLTEIYL